MEEDEISGNMFLTYSTACIELSSWLLATNGNVKFNRLKVKRSMLDTNQMASNFMQAISISKRCCFVPTKRLLFYNFVYPLPLINRQLTDTHKYKIK